MSKIHPEVFEAMLTEQKETLSGDVVGQLTEIAENHDQLDGNSSIEDVIQMLIDTSPDAVTHDDIQAEQSRLSAKYGSGGESDESPEPESNPSTNTTTVHASDIDGEELSDSERVKLEQERLRQKYLE